MSAPPRLAILTGDRSQGTNMVRLVEAARAGTIGLEPALVVVGTPDAPARARAEALGVPTAVVPPGRDYGPRMVEALQEADIQWIALAGYLRLLPVDVVRTWSGRILNIHPALLPRFGGKGMYGERVHRAVLASGATESGCTVHWVSERYDEGGILVQLRCPVRPGDDASRLAARVLSLEHEAFPLAFRLALHERSSTP